MLKLLGAIAVLAAVAGGCGSDEPTPAASPATTPADVAPAGDQKGLPAGYEDAVRAYYGDETHADEGDVEAEYHRPPEPATGRIGDTITLTGSNIGVRMNVTVTGVEDGVKASEPPAEGTRYVAVGLRLKSTGITILEGQLANAELAYGNGRAPLVAGIEAECSNGFHETVRLESGNSVRGCVLFEVPTGRKPRQLQLALENVPAEVGGIWRLR